MLKNKLKVITFMIILIITITCPIVKAEDEINDSALEILNSVNQNIQDNSENTKTQEEAIINGENNINDSEILNSEKNNNETKKSDVYLTGDNVVIDYAVDGNLFVLANSVTINSQIGGDAFICAKKITVGKNGYIYSNLFSCTQELDIAGVVYDLYNISEKVNISGFVYRDIKISTKSMDLSGTIGRNAYVSLETLNFENNNSEETNRPLIGGDLNYISENELELPAGAVSGATNFRKIESSSREKSTKSIQSIIMDLGTFISTVAIIWLLTLWLAPKFLDKTDYYIQKKILPSFGIGLLTLFSIIFGAIILLILSITAEIALLSIGWLILSLFIGVPIFTISLNKFICKKLNIDKKINTFGILIATSLVVWLTTLIPILGGIINFVIKMIGLGIIIGYIIPEKKSNSDKKDDSIVIEKK